MKDDKQYMKLMCGSLSPEKVPFWLIINLKLNTPTAKDGSFEKLKVEN